MDPMIAYCGVDCSACPDYVAKVCPSCRLSEWTDDSICMPVRCCREKGIQACGQCDGFPCQDMAEFYEESDSHRQAYQNMRAMRRKVLLHKPSRNQMSYRWALLSDPPTMSYNAAWGGTIDFSRDQWDEWYDRWVVHTEGKRFYRYLMAAATGRFVGEVAYHYDDDEGIYLADVIVFAADRGQGYGRDGLQLLCQSARDNGVRVLYDNIAIDNPAIALFLDCGFVEDHRTDDAIYLRKDL